jgi:hypothetical protein
MNPNLSRNPHRVGHLVALRLAVLAAIAGTALVSAYSQPSEAQQQQQQAAGDEQARKEADEKAWTEAMRGGTAGSFDMYLQNFANGAHAAEARQCLAALESQGRKEVPVVDIQATCQAAAGVTVSLLGGSSTEQDIKGCLDSEQKARDQIVKDLSTYSSAPPPPPPPPDSGTCNLSGDSTSGSATNLGSALSNTACTTFVLGDGFYTSTSITRTGITVRSANKCGAKVAPELQVNGLNVIVDGISITSSGTALSVSKPGVQILNTCIQGFGKTQYANGILVYKSALDPANHVIIQGNTLNDWGGVQYAGGIAVGMESDSQGTPSQISVEIKDNRITNGPTQAGLLSGAIQSFHPFLATGNYVDRVSGEGVQNKAFNSRVACNEFVHVTDTGAIYNRLDDNNVWEYNIVHDSEVGIDHFMGDNVTYRGNVIYNVAYFGRIKNQGSVSNLIIENNTFYNSTGWSSWIWDTTGGFPMSGIIWRKNIWHTANGSAIVPDSVAAGAWNETDDAPHRYHRRGRHIARYQSAIRERADEFHTASVAGNRQRCAVACPMQRHYTLIRL